MIRINQSTGERASYRQIKEVLPLLSFGENSDLSAHGYPSLEEVTRPTPAVGNHVIAGPDEEYEPGKWRQTWIEEPISVVVPDSVQMAQARMALVLNDISIASVDALIAAISNQQERELAQIEWSYRDRVSRTSPLVILLGTQLGLTDEQIDALFIQAEAL